MAIVLAGDLNLLHPGARDPLVLFHFVAQLYSFLSLARGKGLVYQISCGE